MIHNRLRLKALRLERKLNMRQLAAELNIPYTTYVNYEKGKREPNVEMLICLADYFNISIDYLLGRDSKHPQNNATPEEGGEKMQDIQQAQISRDVGRRIAQARKAEGMTMEDLSKATDLNVSTICRYERGEIVRIKLPIIKAIAEATKNEVNWLLYGISGEVDHVTQSGNQEKLIFVSKRLSANNVVRVTLEKEAAEIINNIWLQTGLPATYLVSRMIEFAAEHTEIEKTAFDDEDEP